MTGNATLRVETTMATLERLAPMWRELLSDSSGHAVMRDPAWLGAWWRNYGEGLQPLIGVVTCEGRIVGLAPLVARDHVYPGGMTFRRLELMGSRAGARDAVCSDYLDIAARTGFEDQVAAALARGLIDGAFGAWDECAFEAALEDSIVNRLSDALQRQGARDSMDVWDTAPYITLPQTWDAYLQQRKQQHRYLIKKSLRYFDEWAGADGYHLEEARDALSLAQGLQHLKDLHGERWRADDEDGAFGSNRFDAFVRDFAATALSEQRLDLVWMRVRGEVVGAQLNVRSGTTMYFYQCGRKLGLPPNVRIGIVLNALLIQRAIKAGLAEYDFLGGPAEYKLKFTDTTRKMVRIRIGRPSMRETALQTLKGAAAVVGRLQATSRRVLSPVRQD